MRYPKPAGWMGFCVGGKIKFVTYTDEEGGMRDERTDFSGESTTRLERRLIGSADIICVGSKTVPEVVRT